MIESRDKLEKKLTRKFQSTLSNRRQIREWILDCNTYFGVPETISGDYITLRKDISEASDFLLFIFCNMILGKNTRLEFFSEQECETYSKETWHIEKAKFPLSFDMIRIGDEQYIGKISVKELMKLKDAQLINYNENAQRTMKHVVRGETEYFQISLNKDAVYAIMDSYKSNLYIPNTITLNLPEDAKYSYSEKEKKLVINKAEYLDILDGYHRYIAMSKVCTELDDFDYEMELRIVQFTEDKARRFIWQEDQKTKMSKVDSDSMDTAKISNKIVERLNNSSCILAGQISRNKGIINAAYLSNIIDVVMLRNVKKSDELVMVKTLTGEIRNAIEQITDEEPQLLSTPWDKELIFAMIFDIQYGDLKNVAKDAKAIKNASAIYKGKLLTTSDVTRTKKLFGKEA